ncbi:MAG: ammonia-forming cytochrome c nitrite reductase subunit c552 [Planctomycetaceae bacterium]|nr:ammonia-forming cytochrome c nitrite reductase subunit c552 [Planctomycetaceae bacterium]
MTESGKPGIGLLLLTALVSGVTCFAVAALLVNVFERKQEATETLVRVVALDDDTEDPAVWGKNFPLHYDDYLKTADMVQTMYGGSEAIPNAPTDEDPRNIISKSKLETIPQLRRMWAGYAFSKDFREERGHAFMLEDQIYTERQKVGQPGTCINCHASTYVPMKKLGEGDIMVGFEKLNTMKYDEAKIHVGHAVACIDCHDSETMALRVTRPAFIEGIAAAKAHEGVENYDVNTMATRQEMRTFVCAQCHVEYHFNGEKKRLTYPWSNGLTVDNAWEYYEEINFKDWTHAETGAPMLKAQHPEFEMWSQGTHARRGVSCADCHMPYKRVGGKKISDHHVRSPMLSINNACQTCHKMPEDQILTWTQDIQTRHRKLVDITLDALVDLIDDIKSAREAGATDEQLKEAQHWQRKASFYVDYVEAENSSGFHASQETARILAESIDYSRQGQLKLREMLNKPLAEEKVSKTD